MKYLLDSSAVIGLPAGKVSLTKRIQRHAPREFCLSAIASCELFFGADESERKALNVNVVEELPFEAAEFDQDDAGQAQACDLILITRNVGEFSRVNGLRFEDWEG